MENNQGESALHVLCKNKNFTTEAVNVLKSEELLSKKNKKGNTPLHLACTNSSNTQHIAKQLISIFALKVKK